MIIIEKCLPKQNGEGMQLSGTNSRGGKWYLWQINGKYDMFSNSENPPVEEGKEYDLDIKEKTTEKNGKTYKNYTASFKTEASKKADEVMDALRKVWERIDEVGKNVSNLEEIIIGMGVVLEEIKKSIEGGKADEITDTSKNI